MCVCVICLSQEVYLFIFFKKRPADEEIERRKEEMMGVGGVITAGVRMVRRDLEGQEEGRNPPAPLRPARLLFPAS